MDRAIELYRKAVDLDPVNPQARTFLAFNLAVTKRFAEARAEYPRVVELNPAAPWAHAGLGLSYLVEGKFEEAVSATEGEAGEYARLLIVACARWPEKNPGGRCRARAVDQGFCRNRGIPDRRSARVSRGQGQGFRMVGARAPAT